jgi:transposase
LGRCLDALYDAGVCGLYQQIAEKVVDHLKLPCEFTHLDSTRFYYDGKANSDEEAPTAIHITQGYSRDHRPELNQVVINLRCENLSGIPVYMQAQSGNINDVEEFKKIVKSHVSSLKAALQCRYLVADAALYVKETIVELDALGQLFITRVLQKLKEANTLIQSANFLIFAPICEGYQGVWHTSHYGDVEQKWLLVRSEQATKREHHTLNSQMLKQAEGSRKAFKKLCQQAFACRTDAFAAIEQWQEKQGTLAVEATVLEVPVYEGKGRPGKNQQPVRRYYEISGNLYTPLEKRDEATKQLGLFILATNDIGGSLSMADMLSTYKSQ